MRADGTEWSNRAILADLCVLVNDGQFIDFYPATQRLDNGARIGASLLNDLLYITLRTFLPP